VVAIDANLSGLAETDEEWWAIREERDTAKSRCTELEARLAMRLGPK
jgi:hypothetical protein